MDAKAVIRDYMSFVPISEIALAQGTTVKHVKSILRAALPKETYLRIAHTIGARIVHKKLNDPLFRKKYVKKMEKSVSTSIKTKLNNPAFRKAWRKKAKLASIKGNKRINELMEIDSFRETWSAKCSRGGHKSKSSKTGIFDPALKSQRALWSLAGLKKTGRKCSGPLGEKMYNYLERRVANVLLTTGVKYSYEHTIPIRNRNGFFSIDFISEDPAMIIEVTYWDKCKEKCKQLSKKFDFISKLFPQYSLVVITKASTYTPYKSLAPNKVTVLTVNQLESFIAGLRNSKRSGVTNSLQ